jgi:hypothetical protein
MRLLALTCATMLWWLSNACLSHAQAPAGENADPSVNADPSEAVASPSASEALGVGETVPPSASTTGAGAASDDASTPQPAGTGSSVETEASAPEPPLGAELYAPVPYEPSPRREGTAGVNPRYAYGVPAHSWVRRPGPGAREHEGLFARLAIGVGVSQAAYRESVNGRSVQDVATSGLSLSFDLALGGRLVRNLILHANLSGSSTLTTQKDVDGARYAAERVDSSTALLGGGLTYYLMPYNAYVTGVFGFASFVENRNEREAIDASSGLGGLVTVGKEWWAGPRGEWGLGVALRFSYMAAPVELAGIQSTMTGRDIGIVFSATYN